MNKPLVGVIAPDLHFPVCHKPTVNSMFEFIEVNKPSLFVFLGDQFDNQCVSHHTLNKPGLRTTQFKTDTIEFVKQILNPLEKLLPKNAIKIYIDGNHDDWSKQVYEGQPELTGLLDREDTLDLAGRGWNYVKCGHSWKYGKLTFLHGETLTTQAHAKKGVETFCRNIVYGHFHTPQSWTKVLPQDQSQKWSATCLPILGNTNPGYLRNKPNNWINGFGIVEFHGLEKAFNLYTVITTSGRFSYGGRVYGG